MSKLTDDPKVKEIFKLNEELGKLIDCRLDIYQIPYIDFKNGDYDELVLAEIEEQIREPLNLGEEL